MNSTPSLSRAVVTLTLDGRILKCSEPVSDLGALLERGQIDELEVFLRAELHGNDRPLPTLASSQRMRLTECEPQGDQVRLVYQISRD